MKSNKKYFILSDPHSFYTYMMDSLTTAGFDVNNENHILVILGDIFDRGTEPLQMYNFLKEFPRERRILIRGNHEYLLKELYERGYYMDHDIHNGTVKTLAYFCGEGGKTPIEIRNEILNEHYDEDLDVPTLMELITIGCSAQKDKLFNCKLTEEIIAWIESDEWVNYYETEHYIFVHSFIPLKEITALGGVIEIGEEYFDNWRDGANEYEWEQATWYCPYDMYISGKFDKEIEKGKTLVCGHWHTNDFWNTLEGKEYDDFTNPIFQSDKYNLIGLDTCTALTHKVNVLVLNEDEL